MRRTLNVDRYLGSRLQISVAAARTSLEPEIASTSFCLLLANVSAEARFAAVLALSSEEASCADTRGGDFGVTVPSGGNMKLFVLTL